MADIGTTSSHHRRPGEMSKSPPRRSVAADWATRKQSLVAPTSRGSSRVGSGSIPTLLPAGTIISKLLHRGASVPHSINRSGLWKRLQNEGNAKKLKMLKLKRKIRIAVRLSLFLRYWWYKHLKSVDNMILSDEKMDFLTKLIKPPAEKEKSSDILFDVAAFKANKHQKIPQEARRILTILPQYRLDSEVHYVMIALRTHKQIANCPVRMQRLIAQYGVLETYNEKRCIVKQGHPPQAFYYIFYGTVAVTVDEGAEKKVMCLLERGESFGELAIVSATERQSSVISKTDIELISIKRQVYEDVFMVGGSKRITDPDHEEFMRSLDFLEGWPIHLLDINPKLFVFTYFQRGAVMVKDSNYSEWLYIIKSGSVDVLKKLVKSRSGTNVKAGRRLGREKFEAFICGEYFNYCHKNNIAVADPVKVDEDEESENAHSDRGGQLPVLTSKRRRRSLSAPSTGFSHSLAAVQRANTSLAHNTTSPQATRAQWRKSVKKSRPKLTFADLVKKHVTITREEINSESCPPSELTPPATQEKRTFVDDLDKGFQRRAHLLTPADLDPQFVKVQTLTKGSTFGLADIVLGKQPSLCLVSNGAECVMINKELYEENCPQKLQRKLLQIVSPYPEDEILQEDLHIKLNWDAQRKAILHSAISPLQNQLLRVSKLGAPSRSS